jgi:formylglycine-generating enzyme required for sulfatase activity
VFIAAGWFTLGSSADDVEYARRLCVSERMLEALRLRGCASDELFANETPARRVYVSAFWLDRFELSRGEYTRCVEAGGCTPPVHMTEHPGLTHPALPMVGINHAQASQVCRFRGGRLPSEAGWERAARGDSARRFPWGHFHNEQLANHGGAAFSVDPGEGEPSERDGYRFAAPVTAYASAQSPHGIVQMAGNVWEWVADAYAPLSAQAQRVNPRDERALGQRVVRGGSFRAPAFALRVTHREGRPETSGYLDVGVRCAYDPIREPPGNADLP